MASLAEKRIDPVEAERMPSDQPGRAVQPAGPVELVQSERALDDAAEIDAADEVALADDGFTEQEPGEPDVAEPQDIEAEADADGTADVEDEDVERGAETDAGVEIAAETADVIEPETSADAEMAVPETAADGDAVAEDAGVADEIAETASNADEAAPSLVADEGDDAEQLSPRPEELRLLEALLFAATEPLETSALAKRMPDGVDIKAALAQLQDDYALRGVNLVRVASKWTFRTAYDLAWLMTRESKETRKLSRAAIEMLAIVAYHQPVTRAEIEDIRGVVTSKGTLDVLLETGWIRPRGRRKTPGRPLTFGTTDDFLSQFNLESLGDLPGLEELKGAGLLDSRLPGGFSVPNPSDDPTLRDDEDPLEIEDLQLALAPAVEPEETEPAAADSNADEGNGPVND